MPSVRINPAAFIEDAIAIVGVYYGLSRFGAFVRRFFLLIATTLMSIIFALRDVTDSFHFYDRNR